MSDVTRRAQQIQTAGATISYARRFLLDQYKELERLSRLVDEEVVRDRFIAAHKQPIRVLRHGYVC